MIATIFTLVHANWKPAAIFAACLGWFWLGWHERGVAEDATRSHELTELLSKQKTLNEVAALTEQKLAAHQAQNRRLTRRLTRELQNPAYRCVLPPDGLRLRSVARPARPA